MLIELHEIEEGLGAAGGQIQQRHPDIKYLAKTRHVLRARITTAGRVERVDVIAKEDAATFWTLRDGNSNSFPLIQIGGGQAHTKRWLREVSAQEQLKSIEKGELKSRVAGFEDLYGSSTPKLEWLLPWPSYRSRLGERLDALAQLRSTEGKAVVVLLECLLNEKDGRGLLESLDLAINEALKRTPSKDLLALSSKILFLGGGEVLLDMEAEKRFPMACDPRNIPDVSRALSFVAAAAETGTDALTGKAGQIEDDKFPQAQLPIVGPTYLYAKNLDVPCAWRYGRAGPNSFPVLREICSRLQAAAEALAQPRARGKTWSGVPSERPKKSDLLLSFVPNGMDVPIAGTIAGESESTAVTVDLFERLAEDIQKLWAGRDAAYSELARFILIRKVDPGNSKVIHTTTTTIKDLASAAIRWSAGCRNVPEIPVRLLTMTNSGSPGIAPGSIVSLGREIFTHGGKKRSQAPGPTFADAMQLFLGQTCARASTARRLLAPILARRSSLVRGVAHGLRQDDFERFDTRAVRDSIVLLGLLLYSIDRHKESYMKDTAFRLGQLLAGADVLHRGFCEHQRGGSIPPSLLGNQILPIAQRSPVSALVQLGRRWRVYSGWAAKHYGKIGKPGEKASPSEWAVYRATRIGYRLATLAKMLHDGLPVDADDVFRVELLLGYIAGPPTQVTPTLDTSAAKEQTANLEED